MPYRVVTAPEVAEALRRARDWLTQPGSGATGQARWAALRQARRRLATHPESGAPSADHPGYRQLVVSGYRILYRIMPDSDELRVVALFGPGQP